MTPTNWNYMLEAKGTCQGRITKIGQGGKIYFVLRARAKIPPPLGMIFAPSGPTFLVWDLMTPPPPLYNPF